MTLVNQMATHQLISIVVPVHNESVGIAEFHGSLLKALNDVPGFDFELIYVDDGSKDDTAAIIQTFCKDNKNTQLLCLSKNFGKESALTAGIALANGDAIITIDGDGQHPVSRINDFITTWQNGAQVVIGVRQNNGNKDTVKTIGSKVFYALFNTLSGQKIVPGSTDFRLISRQVQQAFLQLTESDRLTRGLIDWLGFKRAYISFTTLERNNGTASYSRRKLISLASNSFVSMTPVPLYVFGWIGVVITLLSLILGITVTIEQLILGDPLSWNFTGTALLSILLLFLVGIVLMSQGLLSLYVSHIHTQSKRRPLYVIDYESSVGINKPNDKQ